MTPNLLFLPGLLEDADGFEPLVDRLSSRARCSAADLTRSDTIAGLARDALAQAPEGRFALAGHSMGGYVALALAEFYPERLRSLVLAHTRATPDSAAARTARQRSITEVEEHGVAALSRELPEKLLAAGAPSVLRQSVAAMIDRQEPAAVVAALRGMAERQDRTEVAAGLSMPVLVVNPVAGASSRILGEQPGAASIAEAVEAGAQAAGLSTVPG